jgi:hypothetical protein
MLFDSNLKTSLDMKRRASEIRFEVDILEFWLHEQRHKLADMAGLSFADIQPSLSSLDAVISALRNSDHVIADAVGQDLVQLRAKISGKKPRTSACAWGEGKCQELSDSKADCEGVA